ncbi:CAP domain-containing protein, partial [Klebsiella pneumoniae]
MGTTDFQEECLKAHNDLRAQHGARALTWCQKCVDFAVQKANSLNNANDGNMRHSSRASRYWDRIHHG